MNGIGRRAWLVGGIAACIALLQPGVCAAKTRLAVIGAAVVHSTAGNRGEAARAMDQAVRRYFEDKGYEVKMLPARSGRTLLTDRQLSAIGKSNDADLVVYPKILSLGSTKDAVAIQRGNGTYTTLYARVVNPNGKGRTRSVYFRQIGHSWDAAPSNRSAYSSPGGLPKGVSRLFQYFRRK
jgi:hypothetical protein